MRILVLLLVLLAVPSTEAASVETFVSPDSSFEALSGFLLGAEESLFLATYTLSSPEMVEILIEKRSEGVEIGLIAEKSPAGGMSKNELVALCALQANNITPMLYDGPLRYMHAKYVIRDGRDVLITSENFGYSGFMPEADYGNRGWGVIVYDGLADQLLDIYTEDSLDSVPFECPAGDYVLSRWNPPGAYEPRFPIKVFRDQEVELVYSPDSLDELLGLIGSARESVIVQQFYIYTHWGSPSRDTIESAPSPVLEALIDKAGKGVPVRVMIATTYYQMDEDRSTSNYNTIMYLNSTASVEGIPIEVRGMGDESPVRLHNKGVIIDDRKVLVSSINWNENSIMNNREVGIIITGEAAQYYSQVFGFDWGAEPEEYGLGFAPAMFSLAVLVIVILYFSMRKSRNAFYWERNKN
ncbi:MAG: hypothetical protein JSV63_00725 [Candidatus Aenigmatarchaeota archaeon]|nr:MAG: hypothetical protein JSV63_00725 [Candidatus Aenigmarchaeota archaeon]